MISAYPEYYKDFACIASACRHSCCIGWEIDIDPVSAERYRKTEGALGEKMCRCIDFASEQPHFILGEDERCPFLDGNNLCEIILTLGEDAISEICTDHPRFRTYLSERTETGLGLCCEEAARLILTWDKPLEILEEGEGAYTADEDWLMDLREEIFEIMGDGKRPVHERMEAVLNLCEARKNDGSVKEWAEFYMDLERLDGGWTELLRQLAEAEATLPALEKIMDTRPREFANLFNYFIYRHLFSALDDGDISSKLSFAYLSCRIIAALLLTHGGKGELETLVEYARMYSSEIEYSDENLGLIFDALQ